MTSDKIKAARKEAGISQLELAQKLHVAQGTVANWETNKRQPDIATLKEIAAVLGYPWNYLLDDTIEFDFVPHENDDAIITCPICGYDYTGFVRTVNVKFKNEKSYGIALEFSGECEHTFYFVIESYKGNSYIMITGENCTTAKVPEIEKETAPVPLIELWDKEDKHERSANSLINEYGESEIIERLFSKFNSEGQEKVIEYMKDLLLSNKYRK